MENLNRIREHLRERLIGQEVVIDHLLMGLLAGGHILLEGPPGVGKTFLAQSISQLLNCSYQRLQFTADLMPSDLTGVNIWNPLKGEFFFRRGVLFTDLLLGDELNRAPPRTQAALLEAMEERKVSVDGITMELSPQFTVIATQNPYDFEGTYTLPEAQCDRFLICIPVHYPSKEDSRRLLMGRSTSSKLIPFDPPFDPNYLHTMRQKVKNVHVESIVIDYINDMIHTSRVLPEISLGASPRAALMLLRGAQAHAVLKTRDYTTPEDVQSVASIILAHRLKLTAEAQVEGLTPQNCVDKLLETVAIPR